MMTSTSSTAPARAFARPDFATAADLIRQRDFDGAHKIVDAILDKHAEDAEALLLMSDIHAGKGDLKQAVRYALMSLDADATLDAKRKFLKLAGTTLYNVFDPTIQRAVMQCLMTPEVEFEGASLLWASTLVAEPAFRKIYRSVHWKGLMRRKYAPWLKNPFTRVVDFAPLLSPYFLLGMKKTIVYSLQFEQFVVILRAFLLEQFMAASPRLPKTDHLRLSVAVAQYAFHTSYILPVSKKEQIDIDALHKRMEEKAPSDDDALAVTLLGAYLPLYTLKNAATVGHAFIHTPHVSEIADEQITAYLDLQRRATNIEAISSIDDTTSLKVKAQYESFPYPRWRELGQPTLPWTEKELECLQGQNPAALIAGCGTGREAAVLARSAPQAASLAVDISRASLAYAESMCEQLRLTNVKFKQADILKLATLGPNFDYVHSFGVLHHMKEPEKAWGVLTQCLKPNGIMHIGLYSKTARHAITSARAAIAKEGYVGTAEDMRHFRANASKFLNKKDLGILLSATDYFDMNMYRDLLFHEHEDLFDIPRIKKALDDLGLTFEYFRLPENVLAAYRQRFPDDPEGKKLDNWHAFEQANPYTFIRCYAIRCHKTGGR